MPKWLYIGLCVVCIGVASVFITLLNKNTPNENVQNLEPKQTFRENKIYMPDSVAMPAQTSAHLVSKIDTNLPVVFLTIDDGQIKNNKAVEFINQRQWPVTLFLTDKYAKEDYDYFKKFAKNDTTIQNHTLSHVFLNELSYNQQKDEICQASEKIARIYNKKPSLLRPPGGFYNYNTLASARECGINAVVMWSAKVDGGNVQFQRGNSLVPGDIVLMHFRPKVMEDLAAFEAEITKQNLHVARLEEWIKIIP